MNELYYYKAYKKYKKYKKKLKQLRVSQLGSGEVSVKFKVKFTSSSDKKTAKWSTLYTIDVNKENGNPTITDLYGAINLFDEDGINANRTFGYSLEKVTIIPRVGREYNIDINNKSNIELETGNTYKLEYKEVSDEDIRKIRAAANVYPPPPPPPPPLPRSTFERPLLRRQTNQQPLQHNQPPPLAQPNLPPNQPHHRVGHTPPLLSWPYR